MKLMSYKFIDSMGHLRDKIVSTEKISDVKHPKATWFDGSSFGFTPTDNSDLLLVPDQSTKHYDPIRKMDGVMCFLSRPNGEPLDADFRRQAKRAMDEDENTKGALFGVEPEFFLLKQDGELVVPYGERLSWKPDGVKQYEYYGSLPPIDKTHEVRQKILENLEEVGIQVESCHAEVAPGQAEISWMCDSLLGTCDNMMMAKYIIRATADTFSTDKYQVVATFEPKPFENLNGSGCHVHQSIPGMAADQEMLEAYAQGLVDHYDELLEVCNVHPDSHKRLTPGFEAPTKENNGFGYCDRTKTVRIPADRNRLEYRLPDPNMNPYVALSTMLKFGYNNVKKMRSL